VPESGEVRVPFFSISGADFVEMFVGVGAGAGFLRGSQEIGTIALSTNRCLTGFWHGCAAMQAVARIGFSTLAADQARIPGDWGRNEKPPAGGSTSSATISFIREIGRRDWTRTNDPHHVKVVL
jgi:hypothetical protein